MEAWGPPLLPEGFQPIWVFSRPPAFPLVPPVDEGVKLPICPSATLASCPPTPMAARWWRSLALETHSWGCVCAFFSCLRAARGRGQLAGKNPFSPLRFANLGARNFWHGSQQHDLEFNAIEFLHAAIIAHFWAVACYF